MYSDQAQRFFFFLLYVLRIHLKKLFFFFDGFDSPPCIFDSCMVYSLLATQLVATLTHGFLALFSLISWRLYRVALQASVVDGNIVICGMFDTRPEYE